MDNTGLTVVIGSIAVLAGLIAIVALIIIGIARTTRNTGGAMKMYFIYTSPVGGIEAVKKGWSWPGFFFTWIWAFVKKLHGLGAGVLILGVLLNSVSPFGLGLVFDIVIIIWLGSFGNGMRVTNLKKRGYQFAHMISAQTAEAALVLFVQEEKSSKQVHPVEATTVDERQHSEPISKLINCPDCNKEVSRKAASCPNCGCPIEP
ncbi:MAG: DUF2628 domain-containing protein [Thermodesulfovibrionales bacterium]